MRNIDKVWTFLRRKHRCEYPDEANINQDITVMCGSNNIWIRFRYLGTHLSKVIRLDNIFYYINGHFIAKQEFNKLIKEYQCEK